MKYLILCLAYLCLICFITGCESANSTNNQLSVKFANFSALNTFEDIELLTVSNLNLCFSRIRLKQLGELTTDNPSFDPDNQVFQAGLFLLNGDLTKNIGDLNAPSGIFKRVEIDFENLCGTGYSVQVNNGNGQFQTSATVTMIFEGDLVLAGNGGSLVLFPQAIVSQLGAATSNADLAIKAKASNGTF